MVRVPWTFGSRTTLRPLISWIRRKKSCRSTSFKLTEIGSPVYFGPETTGCCIDWAFCSAARLFVGTLGVAAAVDEVVDCIDALGAGSRLVSGLSTNLAAA